jgi:hypothetical protein
MQFSPHLFILQPKKALAIIAGCWMLLQLLLLNQFGIVTGYEAVKYIEQAQSLINSGSYTSKNFVFYSTEILLISFCYKIGIGLWLIVVLQLAANGLSVFLFYKLVKRFGTNDAVAFLCTLFFLAMFYYHLYNVHVFTESLFFSFSIIFAYLLFAAHKFNFGLIIRIALCLLVIIFTRPTGILFIPATLFYFIFRFGKKHRWPLFIFTIMSGLFLFYLLLNAALNSGGEFDFLLPYAEEHIICGVPGIQQPHDIKMPVNKNSVEGLWHVITNNSELFFRLAKERFVAFWGVRRSFYSFGHNVFIMAYFYILYLFIFLGLRKMFRLHLPQTVFMLTYIFLVALTTLLSCDEWHNRFIFSILPFLLLLGTGIFTKKAHE